MKLRKINFLTLPDLLLILLILFIAVLAYLKTAKVHDDQYAYIYYRNKLISTFSLDSTQFIQINQNCIAEIKDRKVRMVASDCPDKRCVKQGWSDLLPIICLPNQIVIEIKSKTNPRPIHILF